MEQQLVTRKSADGWLKDVRSHVKANTKNNLKLKDSRGRLRVELDGKGKVLTSVEMSAFNIKGIINAMLSLDYLIERNVSFNDACEKIIEDPNYSPGRAVINWAGIIDDLDSKYKSGVATKTYKEKYHPRLQRIKFLFEDSGKRPKNAVEAGEQLMELVADRNPPGSDTRNRYLNLLNKVLSAAVNHHGADKEKWYPIDSEMMKELKGTMQGFRKYKQHTSTGDVKTLLEGLRKLEKYDEWNWVALMALYGLRPAELAVIRFSEDGHLEVQDHVVKRNINSMNRRPEWKRVWAVHFTEWDTRLESRLLDRLKRNGFSLGAELDQLILEARRTNSYSSIGKHISERLEHLMPWIELQEKYPNPEPGKNNSLLTLYSFRHGYAHRGRHQGIPTTAMAQAMRHTHATHIQHYGNKVNEGDLEQHFS